MRRRKDRGQRLGLAAGKTEKRNERQEEKKKEGSRCVTEAVRVACKCGREIGEEGRKHIFFTLNTPAHFGVR